MLINVTFAPETEHDLTTHESRRAALSEDFLSCVEACERESDVCLKSTPGFMALTKEDWLAGFLMPYSMAHFPRPINLKNGLKYLN